MHVGFNRREFFGDAKAVAEDPCPAAFDDHQPNAVVAAEQCLQRDHVRPLVHAGDVADAQRGFNGFEDLAIGGEHPDAFDPGPVELVADPAFNRFAVCSHRRLGGAVGFGYRVFGVTNQCLKPGKVIHSARIPGTVGVEIHAGNGRAVPHTVHQGADVGSGDLHVASFLLARPCIGLTLPTSRAFQHRPADRDSEGQVTLPHTNRPREGATSARVGTVAITVTAA